MRLYRQHGEYRLYHAGCRCEKCREANRLAQRKAVAKLRLKPFEEIPHGTTNGYVNYACRCDSCMSAGKQRNRETKERLKAKPFDEKPHGTERGYSTYGCRCEECRVARATVRREREAAHG